MTDQAIYGTDMKTFGMCFILGIIQLCGAVLTASPRIEVEIPSPQQEAEYVWQTIININFFEQQNYSISLPEGDLINALLQKSRDNLLTDEDFVALKLFIGKQIYKISDYQAGKAKIDAQLSLLNEIVNKLSDFQRNWAFKEFDSYKVRLTLYGPGGSFNPDDGSILIFTTPEGGFKQYENPANIIIHEVVHIGIEHSIVQKLGISHGLKERIVDTFVLLNFTDELPDYKKQPMGDVRLDQVLTDQDDLKNLKVVLEKFLSE